MSKILRVLVATVLSLLMYSLPILLTLSFVYDWSTLSRWLYFVAAAGQFSVLVADVLYKLEEGEA